MVIQGRYRIRNCQADMQARYAGDTKGPGLVSTRTHKSAHDKD